MHQQQNLKLIIINFYTDTKLLTAITPSLTNPSKIKMLPKPAPALGVCQREQPGTMVAGIIQ